MRVGVSPTRTRTPRRSRRCSRPRRAWTSCGRSATWSAPARIRGTWCPAPASSAGSPCSATTTTSRCATATANPSIEHARAALDEDALAWMRSRKPAPGAATRSRCGMAARTTRSTSSSGRGTRRHAWSASAPRSGWSAIRTSPAAFHDGTRRVRITPGEPLDIGRGKWLLNPGAVFTPTGTGVLAAARSRGADGDLDGGAVRPAPAVERARRLGCAL